MFFVDQMHVLLVKKNAPQFLLVKPHMFTFLKVQPGTKKKVRKSENPVTRSRSDRRVGTWENQSSSPTTCRFSWGEKKGWFPKSWWYPNGWMVYFHGKSHQTKS
jgi:hypothetical protein